MSNPTAPAAPSDLFTSLVEIAEAFKCPRKES